MRSNFAVALVSLSLALMPSVSAVHAVENQSESQRQTIDRVVREAVSQNHIPGYSIVVLKDGKIIHQSGYGFADYGKNVKVTPQTIFGLASITKTFTALCLFSLIDEGKLHLDDTIDKFVADAPSHWRKITIRQLATMTSGVPTGIPREQAWPIEMEILEKHPLMFKPGTRYCYSNPNFRILGTIIEKASGMPYLEYLQKKVLQPLKMTHTGTREQMQPSGNVSNPYGVDDRTLKPVLVTYKPTAVSFSSGMLFSSTEDMAKYAQSLLDHSLTSLTPQSYNALLVTRPPEKSSVRSDWAFGWGSTHKGVYETRLACGMNGGNPGVSSTILLIPEEKIAVVGLSNAYIPGAYKIPRLVALYLLEGKTKFPAPSKNGGELQELSF